MDGFTRVGLSAFSLSALVPELTVEVCPGLLKRDEGDVGLGGDGVGGDIAPLAASRRWLPCAAGCLGVFWVVSTVMQIFRCRHFWSRARMIASTEITDAAKVGPETKNMS